MSADPPTMVWYLYLASHPLNTNYIGSQCLNPTSTYNTQFASLAL